MGYGGVLTSDSNGQIKFKIPSNGRTIQKALAVISHKDYDTFYFPVFYKELPQRLNLILPAHNKKLHNTTSTVPKNTVSGSLFSGEDGMPIFNSFVQLQRSNISTVTDSRGNFSLTLSDTLFKEALILDFGIGQNKSRSVPAFKEQLHMHRKYLLPQVTEYTYEQPLVDNRISTHGTILIAREIEKVLPNEKLRFERTAMQSKKWWQFWKYNPKHSN